MPLMTHKAFTLTTQRALRTAPKINGMQPLVVSIIPKTNSPRPILSGGKSNTSKPKDLHNHKGPTGKSRLMVEYGPESFQSMETHTTAGHNPVSHRVKRHTTMVTSQTGNMPTTTPTLGTRPRGHGCRPLKTSPPNRNLNHQTWRSGLGAPTYTITATNNSNTRVVFRFTSKPSWTTTHQKGQLRSINTPPLTRRHRRVKIFNRQHHHSPRKYPPTMNRPRRRRRKRWRGRPCGPPLRLCLHQQRQTTSVHGQRKLWILVPPTSRLKRWRTWTPYLLRPTRPARRPSSLLSTLMGLR